MMRDMPQKPKKRAPVRCMHCGKTKGNHWPKTLHCPGKMSVTHTGYKEPGETTWSPPVSDPHRGAMMDADQQEMLRDSADRFLARQVLKSGAAVSLTVRIAELVDYHGSLRAAARVLECDPGYLSRLWSGEKTDPGETLLRRMGLRQIVTYERRSDR